MGVIEDEVDYVIVGDDDVDLLVNEVDDDGVDDDFEWDDASYDHCDLSPSLSCDTSVATNVTLKDLNLTGAAATTATGDSNDVMMTMMVLDDPMDVDEAGNGGCIEWTSTLGRTTTTGTSSAAIAAAENFFATTNPKSGRRLSNKKLRKKMKNMKKAAAARALAEQKAAAENAVTATSTMAVLVSGMSSSSSSESTDESKMQQKKPRAVSIDCT
jgi:hypothetical protein